MDIQQFLYCEGLPAGYERVFEHVHEPVAEAICRISRERGPMVVGLCGPQGSGKSTMARALCSLLEERGISSAVLSLDDLYLMRSEREELGRRVHPLLATRGVPGTHDVQLGIDTLQGLKRSDTVALPSFDKSTDDRRPEHEWARVRGPIQVVLFEGWCVGAVAQNDLELKTPVNALENEHDADGRWRRFVNDALRNDYQAFFTAIDALVLLQAPSFDVVYSWRLEQERKLRERIGADRNAARIMSDAAVARFVAHYERLTRHILAEMPGRADAVVTLGERREPLDVRIRRRLAP